MGLLSSSIEVESAGKRRSKRCICLIVFLHSSEVDGI